MTAPLRFASFLVPSLLAAAPALAGEVIVPNHAPTTAGNGGYTTVMHAQARSYQLVVGPEELGAQPEPALTVGGTVIRSAGRRGGEEWGSRTS